MKTLSDQLKQDYIDLFANVEEIKKIDSTYDDEYKDIIIKKQYDIYPKKSYPMITIDEISNENVDQYWDGDRDNVSYLAYQIGIYATQNEILSANDNVQRIANIIDSYMKQDRYKCLRRIGNLAKSPLITDNNVMVGYLRYECYLELETNTIYRRY